MVSPAIFDKMPGPNWLTWAAGIAGSITAVITALNLLNVPLPLTEQSAVIQEMTSFDEIHDIELSILEAKQRRIRTKQLLDSVDSTNFILTQFEGRTNLNAGEQRIKVSLEGDVQEYLRELNEMARGE